MADAMPLPEGRHPLESHLGRIWDELDFASQARLLHEKGIGLDPIILELRRIAHLDAEIGRVTAESDLRKMALAELAGYQDGAEGLPDNPYPSCGDVSDLRMAYALWFIKGRKVRADLCSHIEAVDAEAQRLRARVEGLKPPNHVYLAYTLLANALVYIRAEAGATVALQHSRGYADACGDIARRLEPVEHALRVAIAPPLARETAQTCESCRFASQTVGRFRLCANLGVTVPLTINGRPFRCEGWQKTETP